MAGKGLSMREILEVKRLLELNFTNRKIAKALGIHRNTINKYVEEIRSSQLADPLRINDTKAKEELKNSWVKNIDWEKIKREYLNVVSLQVLHEELYESGRVRVGYSGFWKQLQKNVNFTKVTMVRTFKAGERCEIDYCDGISILDPVTGEIKSTELFVGVLCQSRYVFAEFSWSQKSVEFLSSHVNMFKYFGGVPQVLSPDNLKSAITKSHRYDP